VAIKKIASSIKIRTSCTDTGVPMLSSERAMLTRWFKLPRCGSAFSLAGK
jgi:hypothetical protein